MAIDGFIPTIWSGSLLVSLKKMLAYGQSGIVNTDYQGDIGSVGDTVKINSIGPITVRDYTKNGTIVTPDQLTEAQSFITIDRAKYFNFMVDDIDAVQTQPKVMGQAMREAAYSLANEVDQYIAAQMAASARLVPGLGTTVTPETVAVSTEAFNFLIDLKTALDEANIPDTSRWVIIPAWFEGALLKDDRFTRSEVTSVADNTMLNGQVRHVAGFDVIVSNNVPREGTGAVGEYYNIIAGTSMATSFVDQIGKIEAYRPEGRFADAVKGLHVYGSKVIRPEGLVQLIVDRVA